MTHEADMDRVLERDRRIGNLLVMEPRKNRVGLWLLPLLVIGLAGVLYATNVVWVRVR